MTITICGIAGLRTCRALRLLGELIREANACGDAWRALHEQVAECAFAQAADGAPRGRSR